MRRRLLIARALLHRPRLLLLDEPTVGLDPQVRQELWALIDRLRSEGVSILMWTHYIEEAERLCDTVTIMSHGKAVAVGSPRELIAEHAGAEALEVYGSPARLAEVEGDRARARLAHAPHRHVDRGPARQRRRADLDGERRSTNLEDVFVLLTGEEIELMAGSPRERAPARPARARGARGRDGARGRQLLVVLALVDVLVDRRSDDLPARVRLRVRLARQPGRRLRYIDFVGTGIVATTVLFSGAFPAMYGTFIKYEFQHTYDAILAAPVDTEELVTGEALWIATRTGVYGCVPMLVAIVFGLDPSWGMLLVPLIAALAGFGWACFGIFIAAKSRSRSRASPTGRAAC